MKHLWKRDNIQFPRLIVEINAMGLSKKQIKHLCDGMNIDPLDLDELFERAFKAFSKAKHIVFDKLNP
jgi:hypothetical protein